MSIASKNRKRNERRRRLSVAALEAKCKMASKAARQAIAQRDGIKTAFDAMLHERLRFALSGENLDVHYEVRRELEAYRRNVHKPWVFNDISHPFPTDRAGPLIRELEGYQLGWRYVMNTYHPQFKSVQYLQHIADMLARRISEEIVDSILKSTKVKTELPRYVCRPPLPTLVPNKTALQDLLAMPEGLPMKDYFEVLKRHATTNPTTANQGLADAPEHNQGGPVNEMGQPVPVEEADTGGVENLPGSSGAQTRWPEENFDL